MDLLCFCLLQQTERIFLDKYILSRKKKRNNLQGTSLLFFCDIYDSFQVISFGNIWWHYSLAPTMLNVLL